MLDEKDLIYYDENSGAGVYWSPTSEYSKYNPPTKDKRSAAAKQQLMYQMYGQNTPTQWLLDNGPKTSLQSAFQTLTTGSEDDSGNPWVLRYGPMNSTPATNTGDTGNGNADLITTPMTLGWNNTQGQYLNGAQQNQTLQPFDSPFMSIYNTVFGSSQPKAWWSPWGGF